MNTKHNNNTYKIGILREEGDNWERRTPISPSDCIKLLKQHENKLQFYLQPSEIRCFSDDEYTEIGCIIKEDLSLCDLILSINTPTPIRLIENKTHMFFSHASKGNTNQDVLEKLFQKDITLIDYDCIRLKSKDLSSTQRLVSFGKIAGVAGTINILKGIGELLLSRKFSTPFTFTKLSYMFLNLNCAYEEMKQIGEAIKEQYLPLELCPFVFGIVGSGEAAQGSIELLKCLPHEEITPNQLLEMHKSNEKPKQDRIYICNFSLENIYQKVICDDKKELTNRKRQVPLKLLDKSSLLFDKKNFVKKDFIENPENYESIFKYYLPYLTCIVNTLYWESRYPRIIKKSHLKQNFSMEKMKLLAISDISCDLKGSVELLDKYTSFQIPFFVYEPILETKVTNVDESTKEGIIYHAVPNLAASFSDDSSELFSNKLFNYINQLISNNPSEELTKAIVVKNGNLTDNYKNSFKWSEDKFNYRKKSTDDLNFSYYVSAKIKGHVFDSGLFNKIIDSCNSFNITVKIVYMQVGENEQEISCVYFDMLSGTKDKIKVFLSFMQTQIEEESKKNENNNCDFVIMKENIYS